MLLNQNNNIIAHGDKVYEIYTGTYTFSTNKVIPFAGNLNNIYVTNNYIYCTDATNNTLYSLDFNTFELVNSVSLASTPFSMIVSEKYSFLVVISAATINFYNSETLELISSLSVSYNKMAYSCVIDSSGDYLICSGISGSGELTLFKINIDLQEIIASITIDQGDGDYGWILRSIPLAIDSYDNLYVFNFKNTSLTGNSPFRIFNLNFDLVANLAWSRNNYFPIDGGAYIFDKNTNCLIGYSSPNLYSNGVGYQISFNTLNRLSTIRPVCTFSDFGKVTGGQPWGSNSLFIKNDLLYKSFYGIISIYKLN